MLTKNGEIVLYFCTKITITDVKLNKYWQERQNTTKTLTEIKIKNKNKKILIKLL